MSEPESSAEDCTDVSRTDSAECARLLALLINKELGSPNKTNSAPTVGVERSPARAVLVARAREVFSERKRRSAYFSPIMFGEAGWDLLLALYMLDFAGVQQTTRNLVRRIEEPLTSALRWVNYLEKERLIARRRSPSDQRAVILEITDKARERLDQYFSSAPTRPAG
jgi:DNA-binding MarR family transcriptional regulator